MKVPDAPQFIAAQPTEIKGLMDFGVFEFQPMSSKPREARLLSSIWSYQRKRSLTGKIFKYKTRICVDGSQQTYGRDYWEVYVPVVSWPTFCLMLLLSSISTLNSGRLTTPRPFLRPLFQTQSTWVSHKTGTSMPKVLLFSTLTPLSMTKAILSSFNAICMDVSRPPATGLNT